MRTAANNHNGPCPMYNSCNQLQLRARPPGMWAIDRDQIYGCLEKYATHSTIFVIQTSIYSSVFATFLMLLYAVTNEKVFFSGMGAMAIRLDSVQKRACMKRMICTMHLVMGSFALGSTAGALAMGSDCKDIHLLVVMIAIHYVPCVLGLVLMHFFTLDWDSNERIHEEKNLQLGTERNPDVVLV